MATNASNERRGRFTNPFGRLQPSWRKALKSPPVIGLVGLLLIQLGIALFLAAQGWQRAAPDESLLRFSPEQVSTIEIVSDGQTLRLSRQAEGWALPALDGFPADPDKVERLLVQLSKLPRSIPVAASAESRRRLEVADDNAGARIRLLGERGLLAELLTGESPGFRRLYGRVAGEEAVYDLPLAGFQISSDGDDWVRRDQLRLDAEAITRIRTDDWTLERGDAGWQIAGDERALDEAEVKAFVRRVANLNYQGVQIASEQGHPATEPSLSLQIGLEDGSTHLRQISEDDQGGFLLRTGPDPRRYELTEYDLDGVLEVGPEALTVSDEASDEAAAAAGAEGAAQPPTDPEGGSPGAGPMAEEKQEDIGDARDQGQAASVEGHEQAESTTAQTGHSERAPSSAAGAAQPAMDNQGAPPAEAASAEPAAAAGGVAAPAAQPLPPDRSPPSAPATQVPTTPAPTTQAPAVPTQEDAETASTATPDSDGAADQGDGGSEQQRATQQPARPSGPAPRAPWPYQQRYAPPPQPHWPPQTPPQRTPPPGWR
ncbi:DUF4340 domain-containing protein [Halochromatium glycolicum]|uniref:DUF4340 domain-containing protein n=1 Tax=Halochromatium glycolicum TaxID=85075 RepID=A0AAJ0X8P7_9GAMM|nr:DUF4340 domain-containing protein [Halochromatium glycolicum]MBK1704091.1 hypothetical protein [Halochromatium glycolicum]